MLTTCRCRDFAMIKGEIKISATISNILSVCRTHKQTNTCWQYHTSNNSMLQYNYNYIVAFSLLSPQLRWQLSIGPLNTCMSITGYYIFWEQGFSKPWNMELLFTVTHQWFTENFKILYIWYMMDSGLTTFNLDFLFCLSKSYLGT